MTTQTILPHKKRYSVKRSTEHLKPYQFKPGNNANPKGRPKAILTIKERLQLLSQYAKMNPGKANPIDAIREHNRMEHIYEEERQPEQITRNTVIFVLPDGTKLTPGQIVSGLTKELPVGGKDA